MRASLSFYETPHLALGGELSRDYTGRSKVMSYYAFFGWAGTAGTTWIALSYFFKATPDYPRGLLNPAPWPAYSLFVAGLILAILLASAWFTRDRIPFLPKPPAELPRFSPFEFLKDLGKAFANINYVWLMVGHFFSTMMIGLRGGLHLYTNTFYWGLTSAQLRWVVIGTACGIATAFLGAARLHGRFDKPMTLVVGTIFYAVAPSVPIWLGMAGILRPGDPAVLPTVIAFVGLTQATASILIITVTSLLADIADENELKFGLRQEGVLYATRSFFGKIDQAVGAAFAGSVLTLIAFPTKAKVGEIPARVLHDLILWDGVIAVVPGLVAIVFLSRIRITRASFETTKAALAARPAPAAAD
jgi:Na+/melibiose symporter-like transporter